MPSRPVVREIDEETRLGEVFMSSLIRSQRRLAVIVCGVVAAVLVGIALLGSVAPHLADLRILGVPLPWLVLGLAIYPALIALAAYAVRVAERNERDFIELVRRPPTPEPPTLEPTAPEPPTHRSRPLPAERPR